MKRNVRVEPFYFVVVFCVLVFLTGFPGCAYQTEGAKNPPSASSGEENVPSASSKQALRETGSQLDSKALLNLEKQSAASEDKLRENPTRPEVLEKPALSEIPAVGGPVRRKSVESLAPFVPSPRDVVKEMLKLAGVTKNDVVYDLGCGDGRVVIEAAATYGARAVGVELKPELVQKAREAVKKRGLQKLITIKQGDLLEEDLSPATVVTLYLLPEANRKLKSRLEKQLRPGARVVSHDFTMPGWEPAATVTVRSKEDNFQHTIYLYKR